MDDPVGSVEPACGSPAMRWEMAAPPLARPRTGEGFAMGRTSPGACPFRWILARLSGLSGQPHVGHVAVVKLRGARVSV